MKKRLWLSAILFSLIRLRLSPSISDKFIKKELSKFGGQTAFYYKNLLTGEELAKDIDTVMSSASLIKLPIMLEVYYQHSEGKLSLDDRIKYSVSEAVGGAGILCLLDDKAELSVRDLVTLMIIVSDNTATNMLIDLVGKECVNERMRALGLTSTELHNKLMTPPHLVKGANVTCARDMARLLELLYNGEIISREASDAMLEIMKHNTVNSKLAFYVESYAPIAHKTGDTSDASHDVGIVFSETPYIACFMGKEIDRKAYNAFIRGMSFVVYEYANKK